MTRTQEPTPVTVRTPCTSARLIIPTMAPSSVPSRGRPAQSRSSIANLTTIDYHASLLDQNRQLGADEVEHETMAPKNARRWINKRPNTSGSGRGTGKSSKKNPAKKDTVSRQDLEEFKALPIAVRRKVSEFILFASAPSFPRLAKPTRLWRGYAIMFFSSFCTGPSKAGRCMHKMS
jgi:hypothetical protein